MTTRCEDCGLTYNDAARSTICPHGRFLSEKAQARKDHALSLLGHTIRWAHDPDGIEPAMCIESVTWNGMVTVSGYVGEFAPHLFVLVEATA